MNSKIPKHITEEYIFLFCIFYFQFFHISGNSIVIEIEAKNHKWTRHMRTAAWSSLQVGFQLFRGAPDQSWEVKTMTSEFQTAPYTNSSVLPGSGWLPQVGCSGAVAIVPKAGTIGLEISVCIVTDSCTRWGEALSSVSSFVSFPSHSY